MLCLSSLETGLSPGVGDEGIIGGEIVITGPIEILSWRQMRVALSQFDELVH